MIYPGERFDAKKLPAGSTPIKDTYISPNDYFVIPENDSRVIAFARNLPCHIVIHNQNTFYLLNAIRSIDDLESDKFSDIICPSKFSANMLLDTGYKGSVTVIYPSLPDYFVPARKILKVAYSPRKLPVESNAVITMFRSIFPQYAKIEWQPILDLERREVARILGEAAIYAAFSNLESLSLSVLEAMKSGCIVVGDHGGGGLDYATETNGLWGSANAVAQYARNVGDAISLFQAHGENNPVALAATYAACNFSVDALRQSLESYWGVRVPR